MFLYNCSSAAGSPCLAQNRIRALFLGPNCCWLPLLCQQVLACHTAVPLLCDVLPCLLSRSSHPTPVQLSAAQLPRLYPSAMMF